MILVTKGEAPVYLRRVAKRSREALEKAFGKEPNAFISGSKKLQIKAAIYGHDSVRQALSRSQHGKCCYCEVRVPTPYAYQHVEHYRPKAAVRQDNKQKSARLGYYWLSYDWKNLFMSCAVCNSSHKGDQFPVMDEATRARSPQDDIAREQPMILNPAGPEDPEGHITFHDELPKALSAIGTATIAAVGLDCTSREDRRDYLSELIQTADEIVVLRDQADPRVAALVQQKRMRLILAKRRDAPFSAMVRSYFARNPIP